MSVEIKPQLDNDQQIAEYANYLRMIGNKNPQEIHQTLMENGVDPQRAAYFAGIGGVQNEQVNAAKKAKAQRDIGFGLLWCVGGIIATAANIGYIFWGAIVFGGIQFIRGLINYSSKN